MKVFANDKVYVQKEDLACLFRNIPKEEIPLSIIQKGNMDSLSRPFMISGENQYEFVEFSTPIEISFFKRCDWIVDYHFFDDMKEVDINNYRSSIIDQRNKVAKAYSELSENHGNERLLKVVREIQLMEYKIWSIKEVILFKHGYIKFKLPTDKKENAFQRVLKKIKKG